jgi:hypothetical protein
MKLFSLQKLIAISLAIFLSGTCCLLCCGVNVLASHGCPLEKTHHCNAKTKVVDTRPSIGLEGQVRNFCPFISKRSDLAQKNLDDVKAPSGKVFVTSSPKVFSGGKEYSATPLYNSVVRNRGSTYLANCVFRI